MVYWLKVCAGTVTPWAPLLHSAQPADYLLPPQQQTGGLFSQEGETEAVIIEMGMEEDWDTTTITELKARRLSGL